MNNKRRFTFGPVPSRRLGRSLGVDLVPFKTCTYDCIYCQLGRTTNKTVERKEYTPVEDVLKEIKEILKNAKVDYITLSGSGEPTLNSEVEKVIHGIKKFTSIPVAVLTNGALLSDKKVRDELCEADLVIPSLDAGRDEVFQSINRPHPSIEFSKMVEGIVRFKKEFRGKFWLEIMLAEGVNSADSEVKEFIPLIERICPDRIQLNTVVRPPAEEGVCQVSHDRMVKIKETLGPKAELIAKYEKQHKVVFPSGKEILAILKRRPCTLSDLSSVTGLHRNEILKHLNALKEKGIISVSSTGGETYYKRRD